MVEQGQRPKYLKIFGDLERSDLEQMNSTISFPYVHTMKYRILEKALHEGHSIHELYLALKEIGELHFGDRKSANHRQCLCFLIAHASISQQQLDEAINDWLAYPSDLMDKTYPFFSEYFTLGMVKRGLTLVRDAKGDLRPLAQIEALRTDTQLMEAFFLSALYSDDLEALEHLHQSATLRTEFTTEDCSSAIDHVLHCERDSSPNWQAYYEGYKPFPNVQAKYYRPRLLRDYWLQITGAISEASLTDLERVFDPKFSPKLGSDAVLELTSDNTLTTEKRAVAIAFLVKHIQAGADCRRAYLTLVHGRIEALDFLDQPITVDAVLKLALTRGTETSWISPVFMAMFTTDELNAHARGQECLVIMHQMTNDLSYLPLIDSLQYRGQAFAADLGL
jgi:hypothetical protein